MIQMSSRFCNPGLQASKICSECFFLFMKYTDFSSKLFSFQLELFPAVL